MARQKLIIAELTGQGRGLKEAERALALLSACQRIFEDRWLAILKDQNHV